MSKETLKYIYIAGPYTHPDPVENTGKTVIVGDVLLINGFIPYIPHLTLFWHYLLPHKIEMWYAYDLAWLEKCDALLRLPGESTGADKEVEYAMAHEIPVYFSLEALLEKVAK